MIIFIIQSPCMSYSSECIWNRRESYKSQTRFHILDRCMHKAVCWCDNTMKRRLSTLQFLTWHSRFEPINMGFWSVCYLNISYDPGLWRIPETSMAIHNFRMYSPTNMSLPWWASFNKWAHFSIVLVTSPLPPRVLAPLSLTVAMVAAQGVKYSPGNTAHLPGSLCSWFTCQLYPPEID